MEVLPTDVLREIISFIKGDFIALTSTCKTLQALNTKAERIKRRHGLITIFKKHKKENWDWEDLSCNTNIPWKFIENHPHYAWDWELVSERPDLNLDFVKANKHLNWYYDVINTDVITSIEELCNIPDMKVEDYSDHASITYEVVLRNPNLIWEWSVLSANPNITWEHVIAHPDWKWKPLGLLINPSIPQKNVFDLYPKLSGIKGMVNIHKITKENAKTCNWYFISTHIELTPEFVAEFHGRIQTKNFIPGNRFLTWDIIKLFPVEKWIKHTHYLKFITWDLVSKNPQIDWSTCNLETHPGIILENILENLDFLWDWKRVHENPSVSWKDIVKKLHLPWNWKELSQSKLITCKIVDEFFELPWDFSKLSCNPNIKWWFVKKHINSNWCWDALLETMDITWAIFQEIPKEYINFQSLSDNQSNKFK